MGYFIYSVCVLPYEKLYHYLSQPISDNSPLKNEVYRSKRARTLSEKAEFITCTLQDDSLVGTIAFYMNQCTVAFITQVIVIDQYKRQGIASNMLRLLFEEANKRGYTIIRLEVRKNNVSAISLYEKFGFKYMNDSLLGNSIYEIQI